MDFSHFSHIYLRLFRIDKKRKKTGWVALIPHQPVTIILHQKLFLGIYHCLHKDLDQFFKTNA